MDKQSYDSIVSDDYKLAKESLHNFVEKNSQTFNFSSFHTTGQWSNIWLAIFNHLSSENSTDIHIDCLSAIRILSRDKTYINDTITNERFNCLLNYANIGANNYNCSTILTIEALKCLCNLVYNSTKCQEMCLKNTTVEGIIKRIRTYKDQNIEYDIQYFDMKLLFLITALNPNIRTKVRDDYHGLIYLAEIIDLIMLNNHNTNILTDKQIDLLCEILKILFNLTVRNPINITTEEEDEIQYRRLTNKLHDLFLYKNYNKIKENDLYTNIINLLTSIPTPCYSELIILNNDINNMNCNTIKIYDNYDITIIDILLNYLKVKLDLSLNKNAQQDILLPILTVIVKCVRCNSLLRRYIRTIILPPLRDVKKRPEEGNELRNHLCRLLTTPSTQVRDLSAEILFVICKENVGRMIKHTGYGNAAGLLANRGLLGGHGTPSVDYSSDSEDSDTEEYKSLQHGINPVLGCYEPPRPNPLEGMSEEQKEYEAMKLVNLMDRLHRQGIVQPCKIGEDGRPEPVDNILELQDEIPQQQKDHKRKT